MMQGENCAGGYTPERTRLLVQWAGTDNDVLDLGCYDGRDSIAIAARANRVTGVEMLAEPAERARRRGLEVVAFDLASPDWPLPKAAYDVIIAGEILEHMVDPDLFLDNVYRHLRTNGRLILTTPNVASLGRRLMLLVGKNPYLEFSSQDDVNDMPVVGHVRYYTKQTLLRICGAHGFRLLKITSDRLNIGPIGSTHLARLLPTLSWRFIALFERVGPPADGKAAD